MVFDGAQWSRRVRRSHSKAALFCSNPRCWLRNVESPPGGNGVGFPARLRKSRVGRHLRRPESCARWWRTASPGWTEVKCQTGGISPRNGKRRKHGTGARRQGWPRAEQLEQIGVSGSNMHKRRPKILLRIVAKAEMHWFTRSGFRFRKPHPSIAGWPHPPLGWTYERGLEEATGYDSTADASIGMTSRSLFIS